MTSAPNVLSSPIAATTTSKEIMEDLEKAFITQQHLAQDWPLHKHEASTAHGHIGTANSSSMISLRSTPSIRFRPKRLLLGLLLFALVFYVVDSYDIESAIAAASQFLRESFQSVQESILQTRTSMHHYLNSFESRGPPLPVDPAIYNPLYPTSPHPRIAAIATLYTSLINLFIRMQYLPASAVAFPPHITPSKTINTTLAGKYGLTENVVDFMQLIPYVDSSQLRWNFGSDGGEFLSWSEFGVDWRGIDDDYEWWDGFRNPAYGLSDCPDGAQDCDRGWEWDEGGYYMRPWYFMISREGNEGGRVVLDAKKFKIWYLAWAGDTLDPYFDDKNVKQKDYPNVNTLSAAPSRRAEDVLNDIIIKFETLEWIPGGLYGDSDKLYSEYKALYVSSGWPDHFNSAAFLSDLGQQGSDNTIAKRQKDTETYKKFIDKVAFHHYLLSISPQELERMEWLRTALGNATSFEDFKTSLREALTRIDRQLLVEERPADPATEWLKAELARSKKDLEERISDVSLDARLQRQLREAEDVASRVDTNVRLVYDEMRAAYAEKLEISRPKP